MTDPARTNRFVIGGIMLALAAWGIYLAIGDYLANGNPWRPVVVLACVGLFAGFWLLMLRFGGRRPPS
jgi:hypothetical protein